MSSDLHSAAVASEAFVSLLQSDVTQVWIGRPPRRRLCDLRCVQQQEKKSWFLSAEHETSNPSPWGHLDHSQDLWYTSLNYYWLRICCTLTGPNGVNLVNLCITNYTFRICVLFLTGWTRLLWRRWASWDDWLPRKRRSSGATRGEGNTWPLLFHLCNLLGIICLITPPFSLLFYVH